MTDSLFIFNERSGSYDPALVAEIEQLFAQSDWPLSRVRDIGEGALPDAAAAKAQNLGLIVVLSGDGTLAAVAESLGGLEGTLLILPGGTMNLLSRTLHGDRTAQAVGRFPGLTTCAQAGGCRVASRSANYRETGPRP